MFVLMFHFQSVADFYNKENERISDFSFMDVDENGFVIVVESHKKSRTNRVLLLGPDLKFRHVVGFFQGPLDRMNPLCVHQEHFTIQLSIQTSFVSICGDIDRKMVLRWNHRYRYFLSMGKTCELHSVSRS